MKRSSPDGTRRAALLLGLASTLARSLPARAAGWPEKPIRIIIAAPPGGVADIVARLLVDGMGATWSAPLVVDYKPGASGVIAVHELLSAPPDGHAFLLIQRGIATEVPQAIQVPFDPLADLEPIVQLARAGLVLVGSPQVPARTIPELVAYARAHPGELHFAAVGFGLLSHTTGLKFAQLAGVDIPFVGYQGAAPALQDLLGGHIPLMIEAPPVLLPAIHAGRIRAFAIAAPVRSEVLPDVPTFAESGYPDLADTSWLALWARPGMPAEVQNRMRDAVLRLLRQPDVRARLEQLGLDPGLPLTKAELVRDVRAASARQAQVLRSIHFPPK